MAEKRIADRRTYGVDPRTGLEVLVALKGQPLPDWFDPDLEFGQTRTPPETDAGPVEIERKPRRKAARRPKPKT